MTEISSGLFFPAEFSSELRLADRVRVDHVAGEGGARAAHVEPVHLERVQREVVAVRLVAHRRAGTAPAGAAEIRVDLHAAAKQGGGVRPAPVPRELGSARPNVY